jgi:hypothetical protein
MPAWRRQRLGELEVQQFAEPRHRRGRLHLAGAAGGPGHLQRPNFALTGDLASMLAKVNATNATYTESAMSFMTPPNPSNLSTLKNRGAKMMVYHGTSDPIFSSDDTTAWYNALRTANGGDAANFARFFACRA